MEGEDGNMKLADLKNPKYIAFETYKKNGDAVNTPLWVFAENNALRAWTLADSWKVKRARNNPKVRVAESNAQGTPKSDWVDAIAKIIDSPAEEERARQQLAKKYGLSYWMISAFNWFSHRGKAHVVIEIQDAS